MLKEWRVIRFTNPAAAFDEVLYALIVADNKNGHRINEITFTCLRNKLVNAKITSKYNPAIFSNFVSNLPKLKREKTVAWIHQAPGTYKQHILLYVRLIVYILFTILAGLSIFFFAKRGYIL